MPISITNNNIGNSHNSVTRNNDSMDKNIQHGDYDCAVCLQKCHYPTQLPCGHIFCFLCLKGVAATTKKCAMCRAPIPSDYLSHPEILKIESKPVTTSFQWYYEGANGWWKYEERHNEELENSYMNGINQCKLLIAGELYFIDFKKMMQIRIRDVSRRRRVRRDSPSMPAKGIAGIKMGQSRSNKDEDESANGSNAPIIVDRHVNTSSSINEQVDRLLHRLR